MFGVEGSTKNCSRRIWNFFVAYTCSVHIPSVKSCSRLCLCVLETKFLEIKIHALSLYILIYLTFIYSFTSMVTLYTNSCSTNSPQLSAVLDDFGGVN